MPTLVTCYPVTDSDLSKIEREFSDYSICVSDQSSISTDILNADIFCGHAKVPIDWQAVVQQGRLKWIQSSAAGLDHCLTTPVVESDIIVSGCSALFANQVAEHTLALLYGMLRRLPLFMKAKFKKEFVRQPTDELHGKTVGIIGFGGNGRRIATMLRGVAGQILVTDKFPDFEIPNYVRAFPDAETISVFAKSDVIILTLPLTNETKLKIGSQHFSAMKKGSYFINVARGSVVRQEDLIAAIENMTIGYAALDVVDPEPLPDSSPLWGFENVIITPHVGAQSTTRLPWTTELLCRNKQMFLNSETLINQVDKLLQIPRPENRIRIGENGLPIWP